MKFGVREICDVVLRAKDDIQVGNRTFEKDEPVIYFDTAKTSTVEGAATTVYATGGKGNSRLLAWEGERTVTFTMEDALISPMGFAILSGAGLIDASATEKINVHTNVTGVGMVTAGTVEIDVTEALAAMGADTVVSENQNAKVYAYVMKNGNIGDKLTEKAASPAMVLSANKKAFIFDVPAEYEEGSEIAVMVDFYVEKTSGVSQLEITPDKFAGYYYLEAATLFRRQDTGKDMPAVFVIPKVKIQSAFSFAMASSGDPSTFTFTMDAFPDYTKFDPTKQVLFALQIVE